MNKNVLTLLVMGFPLFAFAQVAQEPDSIQTHNISEVEVLGKKKIPLQEQKVGLLNIDVPIKYLPVTVTKLDHITLERKHILNMEDAVRFLPGVVRTSNQLGAFERYSIRGTTDAVFMYDGIRDERTLLNTTPFGDLSAVESIEVIKGAATVLAGHSAMGGVINIIRKKPSDRFTANASVSYGSWEQKEATVGFGGKLIGPVNYRANLHYSNGDGYRDVNADRFSGMFALGSKIGQKGYLSASVNFCDDHYTTDIGGAPVMPNDIYHTGSNELYLLSGVRNPNCDYENVYNDLSNNTMRRRNVDVNVDYTHEFTPWLQLRERFGFVHSNLDYSCVENMSYLTSTEPIYDYYYTNPRNGKTTYINLDSVRMGNPLCFNPDHKLYTNTLELKGKFFTKEVEHNYTAGWYYSFFDFTQYNGYNEGDVWGPGLNEVISVANPPKPVRDWWDSKVSAANIRRQLVNAVYLTDVIDINEHWKAMASGRFDLYNYRSASATIDDGRQEYKEENRSDWNKLNVGAFTYRLGLVYLPVEEVSIYASVGNFYKPFTTFAQPNVIYYDKNGHEFNPDVNANAYDPQRGNQYELGVRYEINRIFDINASAFYSTKHNIVRNLGTQDVTENGVVTEYDVVAQIGKEASKGFDFDVTVRPVSTLQIVAGMGWSDYRTKASNMDWLEDSNINLDYNEDGTVNLRQTGVPRTTFYTYADYTIPKGVLKDLSFHLSGTFTDRIYQNVDDNIYDPARYIVDLGVYYTIKEHITLACNINNLFDNHYFASSTRLAKPRNFIATVSYIIMGSRFFMNKIVILFQFGCWLTENQSRWHFLESNFLCF